MSEYLIKIPYLEGINLLFNNLELILLKVNKEDYNGYSKIYFDKNTLNESYFVYDDCGDNGGVKENCHVINLNNDFLYINGNLKEDMFLYMNKRWGGDYTWLNIFAIINNSIKTEVQKQVIDYLIDIYYNAIHDMADEEFGLLNEKSIEKIHDILSN